MPQVLQNRHITRYLTLNTDGRRHPRENSLAVVTWLFGLTAFVLGLFVTAHLAAAIIGLIGFPLGLYSQLVSATTAERWFNVAGMAGSAVGLALALGHGGF